VQVEVTRVVFASHVALVFGITNTLDDMSLVNTYVVLNPRDGSSPRIDTAPLPPIGPHASGHVAVVLPRPEAIVQGAFPLTGRCVAGVADRGAESFGAALCFVVSEDGTADGSEEEYALEDVEIGMGDFIAPAPVPDFAAAWEQTGGESVQTYQLSSMATVEGTPRACSVSVCVSLSGVSHRGGGCGVRLSGHGGPRAQQCAQGRAHVQDAAIGRVCGQRPPAG
jgi:hypothetical protein